MTEDRCRYIPRKLAVAETEETLRLLLHQQLTKVERDKIELLYLYKTNQYSTNKELAKSIGRHSDTVGRWLKTYREGGLYELLKPQNKQANKTKQLKANCSHKTIEKKLIRQPKFKTLIDINGEVIFYKKILYKRETDRLFLELLKISWRQDYIKSFGKTIPLPRLTAWYGDPDKSYTYSGINMEPETWLPPLLLIKDKVEKLSDVQFNSVLLNLYRNGRDSVAWHSDDEPELGKNPVIASVSLGETRRFMLKHKYRKDLEPVEIDLTPGSLLLMKGETQHFWQHQVPKIRNCDKPRINLTFRIIQ